jgi:hypothetical protein
MRMSVIICRLKYHQYMPLSSQDGIVEMTQIYPPGLETIRVLAEGTFPVISRILEYYLYDCHEREGIICPRRVHTKVMKRPNCI